MSRGTSLISKIELLGISAIALLLILQYPIQATFPIGGDATRYLLRAMEGFPDILGNSWYPGTIVLMWATTWIPLEPSSFFIWWITAGHLTAAASIGYLTYRIHNSRAGIISAAAWAFATTQITRHTEDGTLAQLLSLPAVILVVHSTIQERWKTTAALTVLTYLLHPISGLTATLYVGLTLLAKATHITAPDQRPLKTIVIAITGMLAILIVFTQLKGFDVLLRDFSQESYAFVDSLFTSFGVFVLLATTGLVVLINSNIQSYIKLTSVVFIFLSLLLAFNDNLGIGILSDRFAPYYIISVAILAGIGLDYILTTTFQQRSLQAIVLFLLLLAIAPLRWNNAAGVFSFYESPGNYARLHPEEKEAIYWMKENLPQKSYIISTKKNRHSEWIPILSGHTWEGLAESDEFWNQITPPTNNSHSYVTLFKHREKPIEVFPAARELKPVYENDSAVIYAL